MQLTIQKIKTVREVKADFARHFPNLKIEFFKKPHQKIQGSPKAEMLYEDTALSLLHPHLRKGVYSFSPQTTASDFEACMQKEFGLPVQVFRKANGTWIETIQSDGKTLQRLNDAEQQVAAAHRFNINSLFL